MDVESWLTSELATFGCAACGETYGDAHIHLIAQREELFFVDLSCDHCGTQAVAIVTIQIDGDSATLESGELVPRPRLLDTLATEAYRASQSVPTTSSTRIRLLESFDGDVYRLLARFDGEVS